MALQKVARSLRDQEKTPPPGDDSTFIERDCEWHAESPERVELGPDYDLSAFDFYDNLQDLRPVTLVRYIGAKRANVMLVGSLTQCLPKKMDPNNTNQDPAEQICDIGKRLYDRGFAAANDGNISCRLPDNRFLCTPTMHSKGFMTADDLCVVDADGKQISGRKKRSSEIMLHLEIYRHRPDVNSVVHCHPPHATAFAVARQAIPQCVLPEVEIFLGEVPIARYETPGSPAFSQTIVPFVKDTNVIVLANHGTVSFGETVELAWWYTDILDAYCRVLMLAKQLGGINQISEEKCKELLDYKQEWGYSDLRIYGPDAGCNVCGHQAFRPFWNEAGVSDTAFSCGKPGSNNPNPHSLSDSDIDRIAERLAEKLRVG